MSNTYWLPCPKHNNEGATADCPICLLETIDSLKADNNWLIAEVTRLNARVAEVEAIHHKAFEEWDRVTSRLVQEQNSLEQKSSDLEEMYSTLFQHHEDYVAESLGRITELEEKLVYYERPRKIHSCDIPGCTSCGNPPESDYDEDDDER